MDMTGAMPGVDLGFTVWHRFDNRARLTTPRDLPEKLRSLMLWIGSHSHPP
jgi:hypothetical protein